MLRILKDVKERVIAYFKEMFQHFSDGIEEN